MALGGLALPAHASHIVLDLPAPSIYIAVGTYAPGGSATIDTVSFPLGSQPVGTPVPQLEAPVLIEAAYFRATGLNFTRPWFMRVLMNPSPSTGLTDGTNSIPWTEFSWTSSDPAQLPSGQFTGAADQQLVNVFTFTTIRREASFTFEYANSAVYPGGTYTGRVTFTVTTP